jgi:hypothetical protein
MWFSLGLQCQSLRNKGVRGKVFEVNGLWLQSPSRNKKAQRLALGLLIYVYFYFTRLTETNTPTFRDLFLVDKA